MVEYGLSVVRFEDRPGADWIGYAVETLRRLKDMSPTGLETRRDAARRFMLFLAKGGYHPDSVSSYVRDMFRDDRELQSYLEEMTLAAETERRRRQMEYDRRAIDAAFAKMPSPKLT